MSISSLVDLYRIVGRPRLVRGAFNGSVDFSQCRDLVEDIHRQRSGAFVDIVVDGEDFDDPMGLPDEGELLEFTVRPAKKSASTFHQNLSDLIAQDPKIGRGEFPEDFYLIDEDYYDKEGGDCASVNRLYLICELIDKLSKLAHYHDEKTQSRFFRLVFIRPEELGVSQPLVIETRVDEGLLDLAADVSVERLATLCNSDETEDPHYRERLGVFGNTIAEFVQNRPESEKPFHFLVRNWKDFLEAFDKNLAVYLSGFAFHKAKREVAQAEVDISNKLSAIVGEISGKLLSIPISLAAVAAIPGSGGVVKSSLIVLGLFVAAIIVSQVVENQKRRFTRVIHSKDMILNAIEGRKDVYPRDLRDDIARIQRDLSNDQERLRMLLVFYGRICWSPVVVALLVHVYFVVAGFPE